MVLNEVYYQGVCHNCIAGSFSQPVGDAKFGRDREREDRAKDIIQPFVGGKANPEFAKAYPDQAKEMFSKDELKKM